MSKLGQSTIADVEAFFRHWLAYNEQIFRDEIQKRNIGVKEELIKSFHHEMRRLGHGYLEGEHYFFDRGRFVDMGVGRGHGRGELTSSSRSEGWDRGRKGRKPNPWYSPAFYGRLNDLMGAVGARFHEKALKKVKADFAEMNTIGLS